MQPNLKLNDYFSITFGGGRDRIFILSQFTTPKLERQTFQFVGVMDSSQALNSISKRESLYGQEM